MPCKQIHGKKQCSVHTYTYSSLFCSILSKTLDGCQGYIYYFANISNDTSEGNRLACCLYISQHWKHSPSGS
jgi:hypothetical protein